MNVVGQGLEDRVFQVGEERAMACRNGNAARVAEEGQRRGVAAQGLEQGHRGHGVVHRLSHGSLDVEEGESQRHHHEGDEIQGVGGAESAVEPIAVGRAEVVERPGLTVSSRHLISLVCQSTDLLNRPAQKMGDYS